MITVRFALLTDYPHLIEYDEFIGDRRLDLQAGEISVADIDEHTAVAYTRIEATAFLGWPLLSFLCVHPSHRRLGLGRRLVETALNDPRYLRLYTSTELSNHPMQALLESVGAKPVGHIDELNFDDERELLYRLK